MPKEKQQIQMKCVCKCNECNYEMGVLTVIEHSKSWTPELTYKEFYNIADSNINKLEKIIKDRLTCRCDKCNGEAEVIEILDLKYI